MSKTIYYFTGTGNSLYVAKKTAENLACDSVIAIADEIKKDNISCDSDIIGIITPLYCSGLPEIVSDFLKKISLKKESYLFLFITAGNPSSSAAIYEASKILKKKQIIISLGAAFKMPDNAILFFNPVQQSNSEKLKLDSKLRELSLSILSGVKQRPFEFIPLILTAYIFKHFVKKLDKHFKVSNTCNGCSLCSKVCPVKNISMKNGKPNWNKNCQLCLACINACPSKSINWGKLTQNKNRYINSNIDIKELMK